MSYDIYENSGITYNRFASSSEDIHRKNDVQKPKSSGSVRLGLLCLFLLVVIILLCFKLIEQRRALSYLDEGWKYSNSRLYFISNEKMTWSEGRKACQEKGADLVILNSREEQIQVTGLTNHANAWIGLTDKDTEGVWKWVDGSMLANSFWGRGEPNSNAGEEDCTVNGYHSDPVNSWADFPCNDRFIWICEKPFSWNI